MHKRFDNEFIDLHKEDCCCFSSYGDKTCTHRKLKDFIQSEKDLAWKEAQEEYKQFILNILDCHDKANRENI